MEHDAFEEPFFRFEPMDGAITIKVTNSKPPEVKTTGDYKGYKPEMKKRMREVPKQKAEPETEMEEDEDIRRFRLKMPGVKSIQDIDIMEFPESIEIRGYAGDKLFFKLIPVPEDSRLINKKLNKGILEIELAI
jgi:HSP20 family molecular chaperone IbpA